MNIRLCCVWLWEGKTSHTPVPPTVILPWARPVGSSSSWRFGQLICLDPLILKCHVYPSEHPCFHASLICQLFTMISASPGCCLHMCRRRCPLHGSIQVQVRWGFRQLCSCQKKNLGRNIYTSIHFFLFKGVSSAQPGINSGLQEEI